MFKIKVTKRVKVNDRWYSSIEYFDTWEAACSYMQNYDTDPTVKYSGFEVLLIRQ